MLLRSHGGGNCSGDGGAHEGGPDLHPTANAQDRLRWPYDKMLQNNSADPDQM